MTSAAAPKGRTRSGKPFGSTGVSRTNAAGFYLGTVRRIVPNILSDDPGIIKTLPRKRFEALTNIAYRERLLSLA